MLSVMCAVHRMREELLDACEALGDPAVELADPDVAEAALLDMARALPVGREAHEGADHALLPRRCAMAGGFMPFCSETTTVSGPASGAIVSSAAAVSCDFTARKHEAERTFQLLGKNRLGGDLEGLRAADAQSRGVHRDMLGRLVDEEHVLARVRHEGAHDSADRARAVDGDVQSFGSISGAAAVPRWRRR